MERILTIYRLDIDMDYLKNFAIEHLNWIIFIQIWGVSTPSKSPSVDPFNSSYIIPHHLFYGVNKMICTFPITLFANYIGPL